MLKTLKMSFTKHILMIQKPSILLLDLKTQLKRNGYTTSYFDTIHNIRNTLDMYIPDLIILDTETIREESGGNEQNRDVFNPLMADSVLYKNDILILDSKMSVIAGFSFPFDTATLINMLKNYTGLKESIS